MRPPFQMNHSLPAAKNIQQQQEDDIARPGLALGIDRNHPVNQLMEAELFGDGTDYIKIKNFRKSTESEWS